MADPYVAEIRIFAGTFAPRGWAFCNGQLLPIAQNTALFSLIGTTYGGDGRTTTALPNLEGRAPMHAGNGPGLTSRRLGQRGGSEMSNLSAAQMPSHTHQLNVSSSKAEEDGVNTAPGHATGEVEPNEPIYQSVQNLVSMHALPNAGGGQPHNNMQPYLALNFIIALVGVYPSRA